MLCVKEAPDCINSYKIMHSVKYNNNNTNKINSSLDDSDNDGIHSFYIFGKEECLFESIPLILEFYSTHYLNQSPLVIPVS